MFFLVVCVLFGLIWFGVVCVFVFWFGLCLFCFCVCYVLCVCYVFCVIVLFLELGFEVLGFWVSC